MPIGATALARLGPRETSNLTNWPRLLFTKRLLAAVKHLHMNGSPAQEHCPPSCSKLTGISIDRSVLSSKMTRQSILFLFVVILCDLIWLLPSDDALRTFRRLRNLSILSTFAQFSATTHRQRSHNQNFPAVPCTTAARTFHAIQFGTWTRITAQGIKQSVHGHNIAHKNTRMRAEKITMHRNSNSK